MTQHLAALLERIALRDTDAMLKFYDRTASRVFGIIGTRIADPEAREDVMERIYLEVWHTAGAYDAERYSPGAWLIGLADTMTAEYHTADAQPAA
jgi:RNA polymerase sigma-70 factor, ECF subfamily